MKVEQRNLLGQMPLLEKRELKEEIQSFHKFAFQKSMIQLSIALILGAAFNKVVEAISNHLVMPIINAVLSHTGTSWREAVWQPVKGIAIEHGAFLGAFVDFLLTALVLYIVFKKIIVPLWSKYIPDIDDQDKKNKLPVPIYLPRQ